MKLPHAVKLPIAIGLLLIGAAAVTHAQEAGSDGNRNMAIRPKRLLEVVPMMGPPVAFRNGQLLDQSNSAPTASAWPDDAQSRLCEQIESGDPIALATLQAEVGQQRAWAQRVMAMYYLDPRSPLVRPDPARALQLYRAAAAQGDLSSQYMLGWMLLAGAAFGPDFAEARDWLEKAAAQGNSDAMTLLGIMLRDGKGGNTDLTGALVRFRQAADLENGHAYLDLAAAYANGEGVKADSVQAYKWARIASRNAGSGNFGKAVKSYSATLAAVMQPQQIDEATMQAQAWLSLHPMRKAGHDPKRIR